jgi:hypothetical protein
MKTSFLKLLRLSLALLLINAGAAWALQRCRTDAEAGEHIHPTTKGETGHAESQVTDVPPASIVDHQHEAATVVHCAQTHIIKLSFGLGASAPRLDPPKESWAFPSTLSAWANDPISRSKSSFGCPLDLPLVSPHLSPHLFFAKIRI